MNSLALSGIVLILISCIHPSQLQGIDLTLVPESSGTAVVHACISKLSEASIFSSDQQLLRRIAYAETHDGEDSDTYSDSSNDGGIWQLSSSKYASTKTSISASLLQSISTEFGITWTSTSWSDLRKPFYSAIAARLYLEVISASIPLQTNTNGQANYWVNYYTSSGDSASDFVTAVSYLQANEECEVSGLDLIFVMDASGSVGSSNFQLMKTFVYDIVNSYEIGSESVRVGVMSYGSSHTFHFHLNTYTSKSSVLSAITNLPYSSGGTNTAGALDAVRVTGFTTGNGARPTNQGVPRIAIVITDGVSNSYTATVSSAMAMQNAGIIGFGIGIAGANVNELNAIASKTPDYVAFISTFDSNLLSNLQVTISQEACTASPELTPTDEVTDVIETGEVKYVNYPLPADDSGITVKVDVDSGSITIYASTVVETPNEAFHDVQLTTDGYEDAYIDPNELTNPNTADKVYIAIESDSVQSSSVTVSIDNGDTSTEPVSITIYPSAISEYYGSEVTAQCYSTGKPQPTVNWYKDGTLLSNDGQFSVVETIINSTNVSSLLTIASLTESYEGTYTCFGSNTLPNGTVSDSSSFTLTVEGVLAVNFTGVALSSTAIYLTWDVSKVPGVVINYYLVECDELKTDRDWSFFAVETHANVISLHPYYSYSCRIQVIGNETYPFNTPIIVYTHQAAPTASPQNPAPVFYSDSASTLNLTWYPPPVEKQNGIILYYIIQMIELETNNVSEFTSSFTHLYLTNLHPYYSYTFTMAAVTIANGPFSTGFTVLMPEDAPSSSPIGYTSVVLSSTSVTLSWSPPPLKHHNGIIRKYEISIIGEDGVEFIEETQNTSITITYLHPNYQFNATVSAVTILTGVASQIIHFITFEDVPSDSPMMFNATVTSPYSATLTWSPPPLEDQNGDITGYIIDVTVLETNETFQLLTVNTYLVVTALRPYRTYVCVIAAQTALGNGPFSTQFIVTTPEDVPSAPPSPDSSSVTLTSRSVYIQWATPSLYDQNGVIKYYLIRVTEIETGTVFQYTEYSEYILVTSLHPAYTYEFTIAAFTIGLGPFSAPFNITTAEEIPSGSPDQLVGDSSSSSSITLTWNPPPQDQQNGVIVSYLIIVTSLETAVSFNYITYGTQFTVPNLAAFMTYTCKVAAQTSIGTGPYTLILTVKTLEDAPSTPPIITTGYSIDSSTVAIQWEPPSAEYHNGIVREYHVLELNLNNGQNKTHIFSSTTAIIGHLVPSFSYQFTVTAFTVAEGPYSTEINITMPEDAPSGFPRSVGGNSTSSDSIFLSWSPPPDEEQNGDIVKYFINVTHADTLETTQYFTTNTFLYIYNLDPHTTYVCVVAAETNIGVGPFSSLYFIQTQEDAPDSAPLHASGIALGPSSIHITWDPPPVDDHNGIIREYRVNVTQQNKQLFIQETTNQTQIIIENLDPYTIYHCYIVAITVAEGPYTEVVTVLTEEAAPSSSPLSLSVTVLSSTSVIMSWMAPLLSDHNGIIRSYSVKISNDNEELFFTTQATHFNTSALSPYTTYNIQVAAVTVETGPFSPVSSVITEQDVPSSPPRQFNASTQAPTVVELVWFPPSPSDINGVIQYYNVSYVEVESGYVTSDAVTDTNTIVSNLHPFYTYKFIVSAVTIGTGPVTSIYVQMPEAAPSAAPVNLYSSNVSSTFLDLSWSVIPFEHQNGIIRYYILNITETDTGNIFELISFSNSLFIQDLHPYYTYEIAVAAYTVDNGPYSSIVSHQLDEDVPSSPPAGLVVSVSGSTSADVFWNPPPISEQNGVIVKYVVSITDPDTDTEIAKLFSNTTYVSVESLLPYTIYKCSVSAFTSIGIGPYTTDIYFETDEAAPSTPPESIAIESVSSTEIVVSWIEPDQENQNGIIRSYDVIALEIETNAVITQSTVDDIVTLSSLHPYYQYKISVAAVTIDKGPYSSNISVTTDAAAPSSAPRSLAINVINSTALNISWENPPADQINGIIEYYSVKVHVSDTAEDFLFTPSTKSIILDGLHPYYTHTVFVAAVTVAIGPYSAAESAKTLADVPSGAPQNVSGVVISSTKIEVSWDPPKPSLQNGPVLSYTITVFEVTTNLTTQEHQDFLHSTIILTGLHPNYEYEISVAAYTVGLGPSVALSFVTLEDVPSGSPKNVQVLITSSTTVTVQWTEPDLEDQNGVIKHYLVTLLNPDNTKATIQSSGLTAQLTNLHPYYTYICKVEAVTIGNGPHANVTFTTPQDVPASGPSGLSTSSITSTGVQLAWLILPAIEQNGIIISYSVFLASMSSDDSWNFTVNSTSLSVLATLEPHTSYKFAVAATTIVGSGPFSEFSFFTTREDSPVSSPRNVAATSITSTSFVLSWIPPVDEDVNGEITGYTVSVIVGDTQESFEYNTTETNITLNQLHPFYTHHCSVTCITIASGPYSNPIDVQTLQDAPSGTVISLAVNAPTSRTVTVTWTKPLTSETNGIIQYYIVHIFAAETLQTFLNKTEKTTFTLSNAHPFYTYTVKVTAVTVATGPYTQELTVTTPQDAPTGSPLNFTATVLNSTAVHLAWSPPEIQYQNGIIQKFILSVYEVVNDASFEVDVIGSSTVITGLHPHYEYDITVSAFTIAPGPDASVSIVTKEDVPSSAPLNVTVADITSTSVSIYWSPLPTDQHNGILQYYQVSVKELLTDTSIALNTTELSVMVDGLHPDYEYDYGVAVVTIGAGPSFIGSFKLLEDIPSTSPQNVSVLALDHSTLSISWNPLKKEDRNGKITFYKVIVTNENINFLLELFTNDTSLLVSDLKPFTYYQVQIAAHTIGLGPYSSWMNVTMPQSVPGETPSNFLGMLDSESTAHFSWTSPPIEDINGILLGYKLSCASLDNHKVSLNISGTSTSQYPLEPFTHYTCSVCAFTSIGCGPQAIAHISTYNGSPIGPPSSVQAISSASEIELKWSSPFDPYNDVLGYGITYQLIETSLPLDTPRPPITMASQSIETTYTIRSLLAGTVYKIVIFAVFDEGTGPISDEITVQTLEKDDYSVQDYTCLSVSSDSLFCSWNQPNPPDDYIVSEYELAYRLADGFDYYPGYGTELKRVTFSSLVTEYSIEGLLPYGGYIVELKCKMSPYIGSGSGDYLMDDITSVSTIFNITQATVPTGTVEEISVVIDSPRSAVISMKPPPRVDWNGRIVSYVITSVRLSPAGGTVKKREASSHIETTVVKPMANHPDPSLATEPLKPESYRLEDLEENFEYNFFVGIVNSKGTGSPTDPITQTMPESVPSGPPENITVSSATTSSITINWQPPNPIEANGVIVKYLLNFTRNEIRETVQVPLDSNALSFRKQGLHVYENVSVAIAAQTAVGWGPYSRIHFFTTLEDESSSPIDFKGEVINDTTAMLTWKPPNTPNGLIVGYQVIYSGHDRSQSASEQHFDKYINAADRLETEVSQLIGGYIYEFKVRARNGAGYGANNSFLLPIPDTTIGGLSSSTVSLTTSTIGIIAGSVALVIVLLVALVLTVICIAKYRGDKKKSIELFDDHRRGKSLNRSISATSYELPVQSIATVNPLASLEENEYEMASFKGQEDEMPDLKKQSDEDEIHLEEQESDNNGSETHYETMNYAQEEKKSPKEDKELSFL